MPASTLLVAQASHVSCDPLKSRLAQSRREDVGGSGVGSQIETMPYAKGWGRWGDRKGWDEAIQKRKEGETKNNEMEPSLTRL